jgi:hypothetical protein
VFSFIIPIFLTKYHSEVSIVEKMGNVICEVCFIPQLNAFLCRSTDVSFFFKSRIITLPINSWTQDEKQPDFKAVCEKWEGKQPACPAPDDQHHTAPENGGEAE